MSWLYIHCAACWVTECWIANPVNTKKHLYRAMSVVKYDRHVKELIESYGVYYP